MLTVDFHSHSVASVHALSTIEEMLRRAERTGVSALAVTDHGPGMDNSHLVDHSDSRFERFRTRILGPDLPYFHVFLKRYRPPDDINVRLYKGIECNILSNAESPTDLPPELSSTLDVIIASVHAIDGLFKVEDADQVTDAILAAMEEPIDIIGHPCQKGMELHLEPIVRRAAEAEIALELNNSSLVLHKAEKDEVVTMLRLCREFGCSISLGSDAHLAMEVGESEGIEAVLQETAFPRELIVNRSVEAADAFIAERKKRRK